MYMVHCSSFHIWINILGLQIQGLSWTPAKWEIQKLCLKVQQQVAATWEYGLVWFIEHTFPIFSRSVILPTIRNEKFSGWTASFEWIPVRIDRRFVLAISGNSSSNQAGVCRLPFRTLTVSRRIDIRIFQSMNMERDYELRQLWSHFYRMHMKYIVLLRFIWSVVF